MNSLATSDFEQTSTTADRWALKLRKWYLDGVTLAGDVCIGYQAQLSAGPLATGYRGLLLRNAQGLVEDKSGWGRGEAPALQASGDWHWSEWMKGHWRPQGAGMASVLWNGPGVRIHWNCVAPSCLARVQSVCSGESVDWAMMGYVECLELSLSTLTLPFRSLHWGRALVGGHSVVWINWDEGKTLCRVWFDGVLVEAHLEGQGPQRIVGVNWSIELQQHAVLRDRELGMALPDVIRRQAGALANSHEAKWLGQACLRGMGSSPSIGWAIFERVVWQ
jgi:hypothetical protein